MTPQSRGLRALAARLVPRLRRRGARAVAITGSAARGTASAGSDLDLWVLDDGPRRREHTRIAGQAVTFLFDSPRSALELEWLSYWEVDDLLVVHDDGEHFEAVRRAFARNRRRLRRDVLAATRDDLARSLRLARHGSTWRRLLFLREVGFIVAGVWLFLRTGWRVPRFEVLRASLPAAARRTFDALEAMPSLAVLRRVLPAVGPTLRSTGRSLARRGDEGWRFALAPRELLARVRARAWTEAAHLARRHLLHEALPRAVALLPEEDVTALPPGHLRSLTMALHGLEGVEPGDPRAARRAVAQLRRLVTQLGLLDVLRPIGGP